MGLRGVGAGGRRQLLEGALDTAAFKALIIRISENYWHGLLTQAEDFRREVRPVAPSSQVLDHQLEQHSQASAAKWQIISDAMRSWPTTLALCLILFVATGPLDVLISALTRQAARYQ
jgi:hypothetical protein